MSHSSELSLEGGGVLAQPSLITLVIAELCTCGVLEQGWGRECDGGGADPGRGAGSDGGVGPGGWGGPGGVKGETSSRITSTLCTILSTLDSSFRMFS